MSYDTSDIVPIFVSELDCQPGPSSQPFVSVCDIETQNALSSASEILDVSFLTGDGKIIKRSWDVCRW